MLWKEFKVSHTYVLLCCRHSNYHSYLIAMPDKNSTGDKPFLAVDKL